jgi:Tfp pilus assembly protein PilF
MRYLLIPLLVLFSPLSWSEVDLGDKNCPSKYGAKLVSLQGKLLFDANSNGQWQVAQLNQTLCEGSRVRVEANSRASIMLSSGIVLRLDAGTVISLDGISPNDTTLLNLFKGFVHFISRTPKLLKINSPIANAGPEGTEFAMRVDENSASLWVYEGGVKFFNAQGSVHLSPGQGAQAHKGQAPQAQINIKPQDAVNWALYYPPLLPYPDAKTTIDSDIRTAIRDFRQGRVDVALASLDGLSPQQQTPYFFKVRGAMRLTVGQDKLALQDIHALLANKPNDAEALALQSVLALTQNRKDEAYTLASRAITANPQSASAYSALSYAEQGRFQLDKAQAAADQAVKLAPHDAMVWARKAELELFQGLTLESKQAAQKALELDATLERTQTVMGFSYLLRMDADEALLSFEKAVKLDSTSPLARLGLGLAKIRNGDLKEGRQDLEIAAVLDPNNSLIRSYLGKAYYEEKRSSLAEDQFNLAKERDPKDPTPYFYNAIEKQTTNRPVEALHDMQKAIELNGNRGVYRSKLMLDRDNAVRAASLGRIYNDLGFEDIATRQATNSLANDPSDYSAHRLLSDSYANKPRHELARSSELLQAQLLQPININPVQPRLAYTDLNIVKGIGSTETGLNEYNRLYERNNIRLAGTGMYGSNQTIGDEAVVSGVQDKFSYSLGQLHYQTDGFRGNNDLNHDIYNAFAQFEISPEINIQTEYRHRETKHGDLELRGSPNVRVSDRRNLDQDTYRLGANFKPEKHSNLLFSFIYANREEFNDFKDQTQQFESIRFNNLNSGYQLESQYLYDAKDFNIVAGGGTDQFDVERTSYTRPDAFNPVPNCSDSICVNRADFRRAQYFGYAYTNIFLLDSLIGTLGLSYDSYQSTDPNNTREINQFSPKFGLKWNYGDILTFRVAAFQSVKSPIVVNQSLQPVQIAGFNQLFDDFNGTKSTQYGVGVDAHFIANLYTGIEAYKRDLDVPVAGEFRKKEEELYRVYLNWLPHENWAFNSEFRFENFHGQIDTPDLVETFYSPLSLRYFDSNGFFATMGGTYIHQDVESASDESFTSNFFLVDAAIGYRLPKQYGIISIETRNLLDKNFKFRDRNFQMNERRTPEIIPERTITARFSFNF